MRVLLAYDISQADGDGPRRLRRIAAVCQSFGERVQYSLFELSLTPTELAELMIDIDSIVSKTDRICIYRLHPNASDHHFGASAPYSLDDPLIL